METSPAFPFFNYNLFTLMILIVVFFVDCYSASTSIPREIPYHCRITRDNQNTMPASTKSAQFLCYKSMLLNSFSIKLQLKEGSPDLVRATTLTSFRLRFIGFIDETKTLTKLDLGLDLAEG